MALNPLNSSSLEQLALKGLKAVEVDIISVPTTIILATMDEVKRMISAQSKDS